MRACEGALEHATRCQSIVLIYPSNSQLSLPKVSVCLISYTWHHCDGHRDGLAYRHLNRFIILSILKFSNGVQMQVLLLLVAFICFPTHIWISKGAATTSLCLSEDRNSFLSYLKSIELREANNEYVVGTVSLLRWLVY